MASNKLLMKFNLTHTELKNAEKSIYSQAGQDGVLEAIFKQLKIIKGTFVEFGAGNGVNISNTAHLRMNKGWRGLLMDTEPQSPIVEREFITARNINRILAMYKVFELDYLSIDIDGNDLWVWEAIEIKPKVVSIEYNSKFRYDESYSIEYNPEHKWEGDDYYGASLLALKRIGEKKGYTLVYVVGELDAIFVRNNVLHPDYVPIPIEILLPMPIIAHPIVSNKKWVEIK